eukprot:2823970-Ditylum_brightwellii.AAC.1
MTGEPENSQGGLGSGSDSFVEYLLKVPLLACLEEKGADNSSLLDCTPVLQDMLKLYDKIVQGPLRSNHVIRKGSDPSIAYPADHYRYHQL